MENSDLIKQAETNIDYAVSVMEKFFPSYDEKINFLRMCDTDLAFVEEAKYSDLKKAVGLFTQNAAVEISRRFQQQKLMPVISLIQDDDVNKINDFFMKDSTSFSLYCLTRLAFLYEKVISEHVNAHHQYIVNALNYSSNALLKLNKKK